jgi:hypothetical protein
VLEARGLALMQCIHSLSRPISLGKCWMTRQLKRMACPYSTRATRCAYQVLLDASYARLALRTSRFSSSSSLSRGSESSAFPFAFQHSIWLHSWVAMRSGATSSQNGRALFCSTPTCRRRCRLCDGTGTDTLIIMRSSKRPAPSIIHPSVGESLVCKLAPVRSCTPAPQQTTCHEDRG